MELYRQIEQAIRNHALQLLVSKGTTQDDVYQYIRSIMRENPDIFWFSHQWKYIETDQTIRFHYTMDREKSLKAKDQIEDVVQNDFHINEVFLLSTAERVMYVYKWLALYCKYNIYSAYNQTIYSVFVCRNSVCTGYAKAAQYLFKALGIESRLVFGTMRNAEKGSRHCWLVVRIDGLWYHLDPTFAVPEINDLLVKAGVYPVFGADGLVYNLFCCDTKTIKQSRTIEDEEELPECNSNIDYKLLQNIPVKTHRSEGAERMGVRGCLLSDSGHSASVYLWHSGNNVQSVVKVYEHDASQELLWHECRIMREMAASNAVVHACGVTDNEDGLIIEQATPLADLLCSHYYQLSATNFCRLLLDVLSGVQDCIKHGIYYRDIHLNNIYRTSQGRYVLGDFGSCIWMERENPSNIGGICSPWYAAPETYKNGFFDERSVTYGIGMLAYFLLNELYPPLWAEYGEVSQKHRIEGMKLPSPVLLKKPSCAFEQLMVSVIKKSLTYDSVGRYQELSDLEKAIKQCLSLVEDDDYLLIDGGTSERVFKLDRKGIFGRRNHNAHTDFHSTCVNFPDIFVSNGENEPFLIVHTDSDGQVDLQVSDTDGNGAIYDNEIIEIEPNINDFAYTAGADYPFDCIDSGNNDFSGSAIPLPQPECPNIESPYGRNRIDDFASTAIGPYCHIDNTPKTYQPKYECEFAGKSSSKSSFWSKIFGKKQKGVSEDEAYSSIFAPYEVKRKSLMHMQVYLHLQEETEMVKALAQESDENAERRDYIPLQYKLKKGDRVDVCLNIYGETLLMSDKKSVVWQGSFTKCSFDYFVPKDIDVEELSCVALLTVNDIPVGEMRFITKIVDAPRQLNPEIIAHKYSKVFISYSHQDESKVKFLHEGLELGAVPHFFDRKYLKAGDVFPQVIKDYIDSADLFILCWSENASKSEYVQKERLQALERAFPQVKPEQEAKLRIYPMSIEPRAELPGDMKENYHFGEI